MIVATKLRETAYMRCRTCCKTIGFRCQTHVKSTWVPAYRRRHSHHQQQEMQQQRQLDVSSSQQQQQQHVVHQHTLLNLNPRRDRAPNLTSGLEEGVMFPPEVTCPAFFRCVVVRSSDNVVEQYAYQTRVSIGGHLFKGILYDQGLENPQQYMAGVGNLEGPSSSASLAPVSATFATTTPRTAFPSPFQIPQNAATENPVSGTRVFPPELIKSICRSIH